MNGEPRFAEVVVHLPVKPRQAGVEGEVHGTATFHYHIPPGLNVQPGHLVWVSFGAQQVQGLVVALSDKSPVLDTKPILAVCDPQPYLTPAQHALVRWMADYYLCSLADAAFSLLPPGIAQRTRVVVEPVPEPSSMSLAALNDQQRRVWEYIVCKQRVALDDIPPGTRLPQARAIVDQLLRRGLVTKHQEVQPRRVRPKFERTIRPAVDPSQIEAEIAQALEPALRRARVLRILRQHGKPLPMPDVLTAAQCSRDVVADLSRRGLVTIEGRRPGLVALAGEASAVDRIIAEWETPPTTGQVGLLTLMVEQKEPLDMAEAMKATRTSPAQIKALADKGLVAIEERETWRAPLAWRTFSPSAPPDLTPAQQTVYQALAQELQRAGERCPRPALLHGVTGSGKTEVYLRVLQDVLDMGRQAIVLVPEISLTPQTINRFASRFPGRVAVLHSRLSLGEHFDEWRRIRDGQADIVIGSRSAIFAPLPRLGLIILDEEHEWTYKQTDTAPRYHARDVALKLGEITCSLVVLGSATPDVVTYHRAKTGELLLLELPGRVVRGTGSGPSVVESPLPPVEIVDLRAELRAGNRSIFSRSLHNAMTVALAAGQQVILFLNRRGTATFIMCRDCGHVLRCKACDVPLGYHQEEDDLVCHQCNRRFLVPNVCPQCWSKRIKFFGIGTQKVEQEVKTLFPQTHTLRWDRDVTGGKLAHEMILDRFIRHEADVLIGTQMIAKGLDLPLVTLVGVVSADTALHLPDFRAGERTFQILTQVAGRAGRSALGGRVVFQTYTPEHYAIKAASTHDYATFAAQELAFRAHKGYPPFSQLARLVFYHPKQDKAKAEAERMHQVLKLRIEQQGLADTRLIGPAPCFVARLRGRYRWQIIVQAPDVHDLLRGLTFPAGWIVDIDPVTVL